MCGQMTDRLKKAADAGAPKKRAQTSKRGEPVAEARQGNTLQTLDRGLEALSMISQRDNGMSVAELAAGLGVHRAIGYRLATTLESHGFITRRADGQLHLGAGLLTLASRFQPQLRTAAQPLLQRLAQETDATAFISIAQGNSCVAILVAEPEGLLLRLAYRVGSRHPLQLSAAGIAILAGRPEKPGDSQEVRKARHLGYSVTRGQLQRGAVGVASPLLARKGTLGFEASVGVVAFDDIDIKRAASAVVAYAREIVDTIDAGTGE
jgi:DNA-binding IclR family transcriptional regulator